MAAASGTISTSDTHEKEDFVLVISQIRHRDKDRSSVSPPQSDPLAFLRMCPKTLRARHYHSPASTALFQAATKQLCLNATDTPCPMLKPSGWLQRGVVHSKKSSYTPQKKIRKKSMVYFIWECKTPPIQCINPFLFIKSSYAKKNVEKSKNPKKSKKNPKNPKKSKKSSKSVHLIWE